MFKDFQVQWIALKRTSKNPGFYIEYFRGLPCYTEVFNDFIKKIRISKNHGFFVEYFQESWIL